MQADEFGGPADEIDRPTEAVASGADVEGLELDMEAPITDAIEQRTPVLASTEDTGPNALTDLPDDVNPADALDQSRPIVDDDPDL